MMKRLLSAGATVLALTAIGAAPASAETEPTPPPYCAAADPGDLLNGVNCEQGIDPDTAETPDPRPSDPPGSNLPGGGPGGDGGGPGAGGGPGGGDGPGGGGE